MYNGIHMHQVYTVWAYVHECMYTACINEKIMFVYWVHLYNYVYMHMFCVFVSVY